MPSSVIAGFDYDADHATLTIVFVSGRIYRYFAVPAEVAAAFGKAPSKGTFFNTRIRDRYPFREITAAPA
ncbi:KTSC domain-containing protein [Microbacteriaceae bacterium K1510]|nr:KTSC domain-containing protein [Microbacteriaceae bacterium K1510]